MKRRQPIFMVLGPQEVLTIGLLFREGHDTRTIASDMGLPESVVANHLDVARAAVKRDEEKQGCEL